MLVVGGSLGKAVRRRWRGCLLCAPVPGLSTVATAKSALPTVAGFHPELMTEPLPETEAGTIATGCGVGNQRLAAREERLAIGPGISA